MLCLLNIDRSLLSNILAWLADCSKVAAAALIVVSGSEMSALSSLHVCNTIYPFLSSDQAS
jgi:hypothetical protein